MALDRTVTTGWSYLLRQSTTFAGLTRAIESAARGLVVRDSHLAHGAFGRRRNGLEITPRQGEILALMAAGLTNTAVAKMLHLRGKSIENQINQLYQRLQIEPGDALVQPRVRAVLAYAEKFAASGSLETAQTGV
jgi:DNA-binding NarL/FixJ family response regulator